MKIILSRKGFDSTYGGVPSPIINGKPVSMPIPDEYSGGPTYHELGYGDIVEEITKGKISRHTSCHNDPLMVGEQIFFGQSGAAQSHLNNQQVSVGDVFLFFGLYKDYDSDDGNSKPHHRIFGWMSIEEKVSAKDAINDFPFVRHPHLDSTRNNKLDTLWIGEGGFSDNASEALRLTRYGSPPSFWQVPEWFSEAGLSYHSSPERWDANNLRAVARGQEFVVGAHEKSEDWARSIINACRSDLSLYNDMTM